MKTTPSALISMLALIGTKGVHDKVHGHPIASAVYNVTDRKTKLFDGSGAPVGENGAKAGTAAAVPIIPSHSAENTGPIDCKQSLL